MQLLQHYQHSFILLLFFPFLGLAQIKEPWIDLPPNQWPTIGLINEVQYKNGDRYIDPSFRYAGTGFLINTGTDTLAATAKHILWVAKNKLSSGVSINAQLQQWTMRPKGKDPQNYYQYNLWSTNRNGLRETGVKLLELNRVPEAVDILAFNAKINPSFYLNHNLLATAQLQAGNKKAAIKSYQLSTQKFTDKADNEAFKALGAIKK